MREVSAMRSVIVFSSMYALLFLLHIVFAANDFDLLFRIVAIVLVIMTFFCGPVLWFIGNGDESTFAAIIKTGFFISIPLAVGIAYAFTDMEFKFVGTSIALLLTTLTHSGWFLLMKAK